MNAQFFLKTHRHFFHNESILSIQIGKGYFCYSIYGKNTNNLLELARYVVNSDDTDALYDIINNCENLMGAFARVNISFDFDTYTLLNKDLITEENSALMYLTGADHQDHVMQEVITEKQVTLLYAFPYELLNWCVRNFPGAHYFHLQTINVRNASGEYEYGMLRVNVGDAKMNVVVMKEKKLLLAHDYRYSTPTDALFYLLKICEVFSLKQEEVQVCLSGLIDKDSALYKSIYDYFLNVEFVNSKWFKPVIEDGFPTHYFTTLYQLSLCE